MILFFNEQPVSEDVKVTKIIEKAKALYGSDYYDINKSYWFGDNLAVESLFPNWIIEEYEKNTQNVLVVPIIKNYLRWLFSIEYGYGSQLNWENIRDITAVNPLFLEVFADFYFNGADFSSEPLKSILPQLRKFLINSDLNYFNEKGTPQSIKHLICNLLGFEINDVDVFTSNSCVMNIEITSAKFNELQKYKNFLEEHVFPAGVSVIYGVK